MFLFKALSNSSNITISSSLLNLSTALLTKVLEYLLGLDIYTLILLFPTKIFSMLKPALPSASTGLSSITGVSISHLL